MLKLLLNNFEAVLKLVECTAQTNGNIYIIILIFSFDIEVYSFFILHLNLVTLKFTVSLCLSNINEVE